MLPFRKAGMGVVRKNDQDLLQATLRGILDSVGAVLHPSALRQSLRRIGITLGRQASEQYRLVNGVSYPFSRKDYAHCLLSLKELWGWECVMLDESANSLSLRIPSCPFGSSAARGSELCELDSAMYGGIAAEQFGYAKVCLKRGCGTLPQNCLVTIHIRKTDESLAAQGETYPEALEGTDRPSGGFEKDAPPACLSLRECDVLKLIGAGMSDKEVAAALNLSVRTAANHAARIRAKLGVSGRSALIRFALRHRLAEL